MRRIQPQLQQIGNNSQFGASVDNQSQNLCTVDNCKNKKPFTRKADLKRHLKIHFPPAEEDLFSCDTVDCERKGRNGFVRKDHLQQHERKVHGKVQTEMHSWPVGFIERNRSNG